MDFVISNLALLLVVFSDGAASMAVKELSALAANPYYCFFKILCQGKNLNLVGFQILQAEMKTGETPRRNQNCNLCRNGF